MAVIILDPQEKFGHSHSEQSMTKVLSGNVVISVGSEEFSGEVNKEVIIPANTEHTLTNIGDTKAEIECGYCISQK